MDPNKKHISMLETLPQDLLGEIVSKVGSDSPQDYLNVSLSCKELLLTSQDERVCKSLKLAPLAKKAIVAKKYKELMDKWLQNNNPDAHYIQGILAYFQESKTFLGLHHFSVASAAGHNEATYLLAVIQLSIGMTNEGKRSFHQLRWSEGIAIVDTCWENIKTSLKGIKVVREKSNVKALERMKPADFCHRDDMDVTCAKCFYYKQMFKFIYMM